MFEPEVAPFKGFSTTTAVYVCTAKGEAEKTRMRQMQQAKVLPDGTWVYGQQAMEVRQQEMDAKRKAGVTEMLGEVVEDIEKYG